MPKVLLTNGALRKTLCCVRVLGSHGLDVTVSESSTLNVSAWSKYCKSAFRSPPVSDEGRYIDWLIEILRAGDFAVLFPMDDDVMDVVVKHQDSIAHYTHCVIPDPGAYNLFRDKQKAVQAAHEFGFTVPAEYTVLDPAKYPVVVKEKRNSGSRGLQFLYKEPVNPVQTEDCFIQQYISPGEKTDVCLLLDKHSNPVASFVQKELRHYPLEYGPSSVQMSVFADDLRDKCIAFAQKYHWSGVIEFEFMRDGKSGELYFMEANTRFWNSLHLAVYCGIHFPLLYYQLCNQESVEPHFEYKENVVCRNFFPSDLMHFLTNPKRFQLTPSFFGKLKDDVFSWSDVKPFLGYICVAFSYLFNGKKRRSFFR